MKMASKLDKMFTASLNGLIQIESKNGSAGAGQFSLRFGEDDGRSVITFDAAGRHDSDHTFVPMRLIEHRGKGT